MDDNFEDFFEAFRNRPLSTTKKFCFKKPEKSNDISSSSATTSPFFSKKLQIQRSEESNCHTTSEPNLPVKDPIEEKLNNVFFGTDSNTNSGDKSHKYMDKNKSVGNSCKVKSAQTVSNENVSLLGTDKKSTAKFSSKTSKFQFKKSDSGKFNKTALFNFLLNDSESDDFIPKTQNASMLHLKKSKSVIPASTKDLKTFEVSKSCLKNEFSMTTTESDFKIGNTNIGRQQNEKISLGNKISEEQIEASVIKSKKFVFKKKLPTTFSSSVGSTSLHSSAPGKLKTESDLSKKINKNKSHVSISSDDEPTENANSSLNQKNSPQKFMLDDEVTAISQSLEAAEGDYMNDEEFEKLFGSNTSIKSQSPTKTKFDIGDFDLEDVNWEEEFIPEMEQSTKQSASFAENDENYVNDISDINWDEDIFGKGSTEDSFTPANFFKNRLNNSDEFSGRYWFSESVEEVLHEKFGLRAFRPHQRQIINASLENHDCFVLMPTGGGKSLCYQLPAILASGVTVVISPLRALISDQVDKLNALDIAAAHMCSDLAQNEIDQVMAKLHCREPVIKLLYLTPEKICASKATTDMLDSLYQRGKLVRFVIDEAHCLSQWGHDFRPDYKQLSFLKSKYKGVPIMCLTATATEQVETDVIGILKLQNVKRFIMSFNRPNIKYEVIQKTGRHATEHIASLIKTKFLRKSGIIYCFSRNDCEVLADHLNDNGIKTRPYHAGMNDKLREAIQREWMQDTFYVIVATIAFGMGIDKPDVRFVIHNSLPQSVEAFYQESGRAGRDGEISYSYLFYNYHDVQRIRSILMKDRNTTKLTLEARFNNLNIMIGFAENLVDCRRHLQLLHLGENFDRKICIRNKATTCDNCENISKFTSLNVTKQAKELGILVQDLSTTDRVTLLHVADVYKGRKHKKILEKNHDKHKYYAAGSDMQITDIHRLLKDMVLKNILADQITQINDFTVCYINTGKQFHVLRTPNLKLTIPVTNKQDMKKAVFEPGAKLEDYSYPELNAKKGESPVLPIESRPGPSTLPVTVKKPTTTKYNKAQINKLKVECHEALLEECRRLALEKNVTLSSIMNLSAIKSMSEVLPNTEAEFLKIQHVTVANYRKYGEFFLAITKKFREKVDELENKMKAALISANNLNCDNRDDWYVPSSQNRGIKRKYTGGAKKGGKKYKRYRKKKTTSKRSPSVRGKARTSKKSGYKTGPQSKGLGLMPIHIK